MTTTERVEGDAAHCVEPSRLDAAGGLRRIGERWTLFGLSLEPEEWLRASPAVQAELGALYVPPLWRPDDPAVLHGLVLGARSELRSLARLGVDVAGRAWADLGGGEGYYALALLLEGATRVVLVDEDSPRPLALALLDQVGVEVVVGDGRRARLTAVDALLALYSIDPAPLLPAHPRVRTAVVAPAREPFSFARTATSPILGGQRNAGNAVHWGAR